jgi:hypothetical protein
MGRMRHMGRIGPGFSHEVALGLSPGIYPWEIMLR